ncbi:homoserine O-acetyltransferase/O-succinyltransferase family protein [Lentilactobacillus buchneri]|uniref:Homoserine O-acetyltransferase n=1 Tax=Lentilactobacillus buchneri subsp. silagei CD034 TaxID=1071400 RepID=J9W3B9_LENBU|nr:homoserine O-succinyltransferase [Lentilactobacillus buchneri]MCC6101106.1 homoserine O-succinyltransferase [Lactobacillus sp.]AFS00849.1 homoserine O-succinyltransferase [Lentilactobacillus buchneri subsp. silagei CD034]MCT2900015.1 homoserine O-succinyltransferase [Lentilactobacillus buchneri]MCT3542423.1 homoserine O-succinyltransferase [Lentilactobacillus buchneri]MCT3545434.1 homoserine O-succinyltransferase [Lentilactobacillus buchneri]
MTANAINGFLLAAQKWVNHEVTNPLSILVLNLMPTRVNTERQFLTRFSEIGSDAELTFMYPSSHHFRGTSTDLIQRDYVCLDQIRDAHYDGLIVTGAPIETLPFNQVDYWDELEEIIDWSKDHATECLYECWAAQACLFHDFGVRKHLLLSKLFGVYPAETINAESPIARGFGAGGLLKMPQSRHTGIVLDEDHLPEGLTVDVSAAVTGPIILSADSLHSTYITGHPEYSEGTLALEYYRDLYEQMPIRLPQNYFIDQDSGTVDYSWKNSSIQIYDNWMKIIANKKVGLSI